MTEYNGAGSTTPAVVEPITDTTTTTTPAVVLPLAADAAAVAALEPRPVVRVDISSLTFGDLAILERLGNQDKVPMVEVIAFLNRVVVGGIDTVPLIHAREVIRLVNAAVKELANPNG